MKLYLIRHAQSKNNARGENEARVSDPPLTKIGKMQAQALAQHLARGVDTAPKPGSNNLFAAQPYRITQLYTSAMGRALATTQPIAEALRLTPYVWIDLHEFGGVYLEHDDERGTTGYPGKTRREITNEYPSYVLPEEITDLGWWNRGREDWTSGMARAQRVLQSIHKWWMTDESIALVSHGDFLNFLINMLFGVNNRDYLYFAHYNGAISKFDFRADKRIHVEYLNRIDFMPAKLMT